MKYKHQLILPCLVLASVSFSSLAHAQSVNRSSVIRSTSIEAIVGGSYTNPSDVAPNQVDDWSTTLVAGPVTNTYDSALYSYGGSVSTEVNDAPLGTLSFGNADYSDSFSVSSITSFWINASTSIFDGPYSSYHSRVRFLEDGVSLWDVGYGLDPFSGANPGSGVSSNTSGGFNYNLQPGKTYTVLGSVGSAGTGGFDIAYAVPEPSSALLSSFAAGLLLIRRRR